MSNRLNVLALAFIDGLAALQIYRSGMEWPAFVFLAISLYLLVSIDDNDRHRR